MWWSSCFGLSVLSCFIRRQRPFRGTSYSSHIVSSTALCGAWSPSIVQLFLCWLKSCSLVDCSLWFWEGQDKDFGLRVFRCGQIIWPCHRCLRKFIQSMCCQKICCLRTNFFGSVLEGKPMRGSVLKMKKELRIWLVLISTLLLILDSVHLSFLELLISFVEFGGKVCNSYFSFLVRPQD